MGPAFPLGAIAEIGTARHRIPKSLVETETRMERRLRACSLGLVVAVLTSAAPARPDDGPSAPAAPAPTTAKEADLPAAAPFAPGVLVRKDVEYGTGSGRALHLDVYTPEKSAGPAPFILWIHGGGWIGGEKSPCLTVGLVAKGYVTASIEYRLATEAAFPAQIEDCKAAVRWVRTHAKALGVDPARIGAAGGSAGGHLAALLGVAGDAADLEGKGGNPGVSSSVAAVCDIFGPTDLLHFDGHGSILVASANDSVVAQLLGGPLATHQELARKASPITYVTKDDPPFLILHGDKDNIVPVDQSERFDAALKKAGVDSTLVVVPGAGHGDLGPDATLKLVDFFDKHLTPGKPGASTEKPAAPAPSKPAK